MCGLKQFGQICYSHLIEYLLKEWYKNDHVCPCVFIKKVEYEFVIIVLYVDDFNIIGTHKKTSKSNRVLKKGVWDERYWKNKTLF